jgi:fatty-acid desaturase
MGMTWYELDLGWWMVRALEMVGAVREVQAWHRDPALRKTGARLQHPRLAAWP